MAACLFYSCYWRPRYQLDQQAGGATPTTKDLYGFSTVDASCRYKWPGIIA
jgi:hypothetical protein